MIVNVALNSYNIKSKLEEHAKKTEGGPTVQELWNELHELFPEQIQVWAPGKNDAPWFSSTFIMDLEIAGPYFFKYGISLEIEGLGKGGMMVKLTDRILELERDHTLLRQELHREGGIVQIHVPNLGLMMMNEVTHIDDACTDELQRLLNDGWNILAVCPPNAQRRPDYILGRYNKDHKR